MVAEVGVSSKESIEFLIALMIFFAIKSKYFFTFKNPSIRTTSLKYHFKIYVEFNLIVTKSTFRLRLSPHL